MPPMVWSVAPADDTRLRLSWKLMKASPRPKPRLPTPTTLRSVMPVCSTFAIGEDEDAPNFEVAATTVIATPTNNDTYRVVVQASDGGKTQEVSYFKVIVRGHRTWRRRGRSSCGPTAEEQANATLLWPQVCGSSRMEPRPDRERDRFLMVMPPGTTSHTSGTGR